MVETVEMPPEPDSMSWCDWREISTQQATLAARLTQASEILKRVTQEPVVVGVSTDVEGKIEGYIVQVGRFFVGQRTSNLFLFDSRCRIAAPPDTAHALEALQLLERLGWTDTARLSIPWRPWPVSTHTHLLVSRQCGQNFFVYSKFTFLVAPDRLILLGSAKHALGQRFPITPDQPHSVDPTDILVKMAIDRLQWEFNTYVSLEDTNLLHLTLIKIFDSMLWWNMDPIVLASQPMLSDVTNYYGWEALRVGTFSWETQDGLFISDDTDPWQIRAAKISLSSLQTKQWRTLYTRAFGRALGRDEGLAVVLDRGRRFFVVYDSSKFQSIVYEINQRKIEFIGVADNFVTVNAEMVLRWKTIDEYELKLAQQFEAVRSRHGYAIAHVRSGATDIGWDNYPGDDIPGSSEFPV